MRGKLSLHVAFGTLFAIGALAPLALAAEVETSRDRTDKIFVALDTPTKVEFAETPLADVATFLQDRIGVPVVLDRLALESAGVAPEVAVTLTLKDVSLRSVLNHMLRPHGLGFTIRDESLVITDRATADETQFVKVYPLAGLVTEDLSAEQIVEMLVSLLPDAVRARGEKPATGGPTTQITYLRDKLLVKGSEPRHGEIGELLQVLARTDKRAVAKKSTPKSVAEGLKYYEKAFLPKSEGDDVTADRIKFYEKAFRKQAEAAAKAAEPKQ